MRLSILVATLALIVLPLPTTAQQESTGATQPTLMECSGEHMMKMAEMLSEMQRDMLLMNGMLDQIRSEMMRGASGGMEHMMPPGGSYMSDVTPMGDAMTNRMQVLGAMMGHMQNEMSMMATMHELMGCPMFMTP